MKPRPGLSVAMAMYEHNANRVATLLRAASPGCAPEIIALGHLEAMLRINDCLEQGKFVGILADRTLGDAPAQVVSFLGRPALFPSGPMRAAAALKRPVIFMTGLYRGGNRYHVVFRQIADFSPPAAMVTSPSPRCSGSPFSIARSSHRGSCSTTHPTVSRSAL